MTRKDRVILTVDVVITDAQGRILVMERGTEPFKGCWVLPGGIVEPGETVENAAVRDALEETGLELRIERLIGVYSRPGRDPRGSFVSVASHGTIVGGELQATDEARAFQWITPGDVPPMGFDHGRIVGDLREREGG